MLPMTVAITVARQLPTGSLAGVLWLVLGLAEVCYGLFGKEYRKGRFGQGEVITSPWRILRDRIGWCLWGVACLYFSYSAFRH